MSITSGFWAGRTVIVTGHMGFKGAWLCQLLARLGASTIGFGRDNRPNLLYRRLTVPDHRSVIGDVNDTPTLRQTIQQSRASVLLHLAAQPIVLTSYADPMGTFRDNVQGTASVLEAARNIETLEAIVVITSDKVYRNRGGQTLFAEGDELGGVDPYSASKAAAELIVQSMAASFFAHPDAAVVSTARAGNVIGGGDWAEHRLLPDAVRAFSAGEAVRIRNPSSTRPWQHVLEPLTGYLRLAEVMVEERQAFGARAWNFGPAAEDSVPVQQVMDMFIQCWGEGARYELSDTTDTAPEEARGLAVDASLARDQLGWRPRWRVNEAVRRTAHWYRQFALGEPAQGLVDSDIDAFILDEPGDLGSIHGA